MFSAVFLLFFVLGAVNAKQAVPSSKPVKATPVAVPVAKPVAKPVTKPVAVPVAKPVKTPVVKPTKPKPAPPSPAINTVWSNNVADFNTFYPINGTIGMHI